MIGFNLLIPMALAVLAFQAVEAGPPVVEPSALTRDPNLIGREVIVDDRIRYFQAHRSPKGQVFDELHLKRTEVIFKLPIELRPERPPRQPVARIHGVLQSDGRQITCEVTKLELLPADPDRLDAEIKRLSPTDSANRAKWAAWAERRAKDFKDPELAEKGKVLEVEAVLIDAERPKADLLALARHARNRGLAEDCVGALAHRGLRDALRAAKTTDDLTRLASEVLSYLPKANESHSAAGLESWKARLETNAISVYRQAGAEIRAALDRDLYAEVVRLSLDRKLTDRPADALSLAEEARIKLPDRPELAKRIRNQGLASSERDVARLRLSDVDALAKVFENDGERDRARKLYKTWLDSQQKRLTPSDADGQILLAGQYERLLADKKSAADLLRLALKSDPQSKSAADLLRKMGYRKSPEGDWYDPASNRSSASEGAAVAVSPSRPSSSGESLKGMTMAEARAKLGGKPDRIVRSISQDATIEQWIYQSPRGTRVVNILRRRGRVEPEVVGSYTIPKTLP